MSLDELLADVEDKHRLFCRAKAELAESLTNFQDHNADRDYRYVQNEIAAALHISRRGADRLLSQSSELTERPAVLKALAQGLIDESKALLIVDQVRLLKEPQASVAEADLLEYAPTRTYTSVRRHAQTLIHKLDPKAAEARHEEKRKARMVEKVNLDDGMCQLNLMMTAFQGSLAYARIDQIARALPKDGRTLDQKRADVTLDLLLGKETDAPAGQVLVYLTMPITSLMGMNDDPAVLAGYGPIPAPIAREVAAGGIWKRILTDPVTGMAEEVSNVYRPTAKQRELIHARYPRCTAIGCQQPAHRCDLDHCCPFDGANTTIKNLRPKCRHHHRMKHESNWACKNLPDGRHVWNTPAGRVYETEPEPIAEPAPIPEPAPF
ncbi:HNH endonuclease [Allokutzneria sp. A3M-2-11 16]|uniref:HNH endonuclease signature motif containing protein n=1 Tax=Allokutzneria sp. A3M-2-11 16 TaxID=2962043 RepID=UPI0020B886ED|nr:HNH endonuclease signature motif containing protein [Allokutzneria sp. A3M-2-11 16]MCP3803763.1 HNH endonuclease [Allokutzneria sp. A3M-2-11 16]